MNVAPGSWNPVLVTGAGGFVGACLVRRLLDDGCTVHVLLRDPERAWRLADVLPRLVVHRGDLRDTAAVGRLLTLVRPRLVYHLAAYGAYESQADARQIIETNVLGSYNLLAAAAATGVGLLVSTGSSSEYGFKSKAMAEEDCPEPNSYYAVAKAAQTHLALLEARRQRVPAVVLRLFSIYGPWEEPTRLFPTILRRAMAGLPLEMVRPDTARDFVYVDDLVDLLRRPDVLREGSGEVYNVASGVQTTLAELVDLVLETLKSRSEVHWGAMAARHWDSACWVGDPAKTRKRLGWSATTSLQEGVLRMAQWMQSRRDEDGRHAAA